jgi:hypothetical protein
VIETALPHHHSKGSCVPEDITRQSVLFPKLFRRPVVVKFDQPHASSDGGAILLKACDERIGLTERLASCIVDARQAGKVEHSVRDLVRQRLYGIACGYAECNDAARLAQDPIQKLLIGRDPLSGAALASQPTLSRFENAPRRADLYRMGEALAECVLERHRRRLGRRVRHITLDLDPTDDPTHGGQQLTFFNGHYDTWCYLPAVGFVTFNHEPEQYLFRYVRRPGNAPAKQGAMGILDRMIERLRAAFPKARILVRLDGGFAGPALLNFLEEAKVEVQWLRNPGDLWGTTALQRAPDVPRSLPIGLCLFELSATIRSSLRSRWKCGFSGAPERNSFPVRHLPPDPLDRSVPEPNQPEPGRRGLHSEESQRNDHGRREAHTHE